MKLPWRPLLPAVLVLLATAPAGALSPAEQKAELARIAREREQVQARFAERERDCRQRFVVTPCIEDARRERRAGLERLRRQEEVIDEAQRKQRAAERIDEIRAKVSAEEAKRRETGARERRKAKERGEAAEHSASAVSASAAAAETVPGPGPAPAPVPAPRGDKPTDTAERARKIAEYERRQEEARIHREDVERRNAQRAAEGRKPAAPLPLPQPASRPASR